MVVLVLCPMNPRLLTFTQPTVVVCRIFIEWVSDGQGKPIIGPWSKFALPIWPLNIRFFLYLLGTDRFQSSHPRAEMQSAAVQKFALQHSGHLEGSIWKCQSQRCPNIIISIYQDMSLYNHILIYHTPGNLNPSLRPLPVGPWWKILAFPPALKLFFVYNDEHYQDFKESW